MTPDTPAVSRRRNGFAASVVAILTAFGAGATFANILFGLPGLTRLREQAPELGVLLVPTTAALGMMAALLVAQRFFRGYVVTAAGAFAGLWGFAFIDEHLGGPDMTGAWLVLIALGGGVALAGLVSVTAAAGPSASEGEGVVLAWERAAIAVGLTTGFALNGKVGELASTRDLPPYLPALLTCLLAIVAVIVARQGPASRAEAKPILGAAAVTAAAGVVVMVALLIRSGLIDDFAPARPAAQSGTREAIAASLLSVAALITLLLAWVAAKVGGGPAGACFPVLGFGLAAPMTPVALGFSSVAGNGWPLVAAAIVVSATLGALAKLRYDRPWEAIGVLAAGCGLLLISTSTGGGYVHGEYLLMVCGGSFALAAGLARATHPAAAALGVAAMMLAAQALGPSTLEALKLDVVADTSRQAVLPSAAAAVVLVVMFALGRAGRGTR